MRRWRRFRQQFFGLCQVQPLDHLAVQRNHAFAGILGT